MHHVAVAVISNFISSALGFVLNKARNKVAEKLKEKGDVTDEKLRNAIIEDLNDIKKKIDGLARKDLLASHAFLNEGIVTLYLALDEAKDELTSIDKRQSWRSGGLDEAVKLSTAIQKMNNKSNTKLLAAKDCFKAAREKATEAFCNESLSLPDRIMATKLRVASKILECLQDTKAAAAGCMLFLEELHNLPAIGGTFSTFLKGGIKSRVHKDSRVENVKSVISLNFGISEFIAMFSGKLPNMTNWPKIPLPTRDGTINPLVIDPSVVKDMFNNVESQLPEDQLISIYNLNLYFSSS